MSRDIRIKLNKDEVESLLKGEGIYWTEQNCDIEILTDKPEEEKVKLNLALEILDSLIDIAGENIYDSDDESVIHDFDSDNKILREYIINK